MRLAFIRPVFAFNLFARRKCGAPDVAFGISHTIWHSAPSKAAPATCRCHIPRYLSHQDGVPVGEVRVLQGHQRPRDAQCVRRGGVKVRMVAGVRPRGSPHRSPVGAARAGGAGTPMRCAPKGHSSAAAPAAAVRRCGQRRRRRRTVRADRVRRRRGRARAWCVVAVRRARFTPATAAAAAAAAALGALCAEWCWHGMRPVPRTRTGIRHISPSGARGSRRGADARVRAWPAQRSLPPQQQRPRRRRAAAPRRAPAPCAASRISLLSSCRRRLCRSPSCLCPLAPDLLRPLPRRPMWMPGASAPAHLDGSLPGDFGFDPLGLGVDKERLSW
eukprot:364493-Chlamydomonas_euryale.AAC.10